MPEMDGYNATRHIRQQLQLQLPVIALTAGVTQSEREQCVNAGMNDFVSKPIEVTTLLETIVRWVPAARTTETALPPLPTSKQVDQTSTSPPFSTEFTRLYEACQHDESRRQALRSVMRNIAQSSTLRLQEVESKWQAHLFEEAAAQVHTMRGSIGLVGGKRFIDATTALEKAILEKAEGEAIPLFEQVKSEFEQVIASANAWLSSHPSAASDTATIDTATLATSPTPIDTKTLQEFKQLLQDRNFAATTLYYSIRTSLAQLLPIATIDGLDLAIDQLEFTTASTILDQVHLS